jgi:hypothetical protein
MAEPTTAGATARTSPTPTGKQALYEAAQDVVRKQADERRAQVEAERAARSRISPIVTVGCAIILMVLAYVAVVFVESVQVYGFENRGGNDTSLESRRSEGSLP